MARPERNGFRHNQEMAEEMLVVDGPDFRKAVEKELQAFSSFLLTPSEALNLILVTDNVATISTILGSAFDGRTMQLKDWPKALEIIEERFFSHRIKKRGSTSLFSKDCLNEGMMMVSEVADLNGFQEISVRNRLRLLLGKNFLEILPWVFFPRQGERRLAMPPGLLVALKTGKAKEKLSVYPKIDFSPLPLLESPFVSWTNEMLGERLHGLIVKNDLQSLGENEIKEALQIESDVLAKNEGFLIKTANGFVFSWRLPPDLFFDLHQAGRGGFLEGVRRFNPQKRKMLVTYAGYWAKEAIIEEILNIFGVKRKYYACEMRSVFRLIEKGEDQLKLEPEEINRIRFLTSPSSLDDGKEDEDEHPLEETLRLVQSDLEETLIEKLLREGLEQVLDGLDYRQKRVLKDRYGLDGADGYTLEEIGVKLGVSRERVRQIEEKALQKLRHPSRSRKLKSLL